MRIRHPEMAAKSSQVGASGESESVNESEEMVVDAPSMVKRAEVEGTSLTRLSVAVGDAPAKTNEAGRVSVVAVSSGG